MVMVASACLISSKICDQDGKLITKSDALALGRYCCNFVGGAVTAAAGSEAAKTKWRESVKALKDAAMVVKGKYKDLVARCTAKVCELVQRNRIPRSINGVGRGGIPRRLRRSINGHERRRVPRRRDLVISGKYNGI
jgi:hypothetical protein